jgi:DUF1009 family protein
MRFDVPVVGVRTIESMQGRRDGHLGRRGRTLVVDGAAFVEAADARASPSSAGRRR